MDRYSMNRSDMRTRSPRMNTGSCGHSHNGCTAIQMKPPACDCTAGIYHHIDQMPVGMAYVPLQIAGTLFEPCKALNMGTVFPELCKPFCGKRGGCR